METTLRLQIKSEIEKVITDFYEDLFATSNPTTNNITQVTKHITPLVILETNTNLSAPFTKEEAKKALFDLSPSKAPGPDGFTALFYQNT